MQKAIWGLFLLAFAYDYISHKNENIPKEVNTHSPHQRESKVNMDDGKNKKKIDKVNAQQNKDRIHIYIQYWYLFCNIALPDLSLNTSKKFEGL
jgi:hypothetical protein